MPATATPRKPQTLARRLAETRNTNRNRSLAAMLGLGDSEKELARDFGSGLNDVLGRGTIAGLIGLPGDLGGLAENGIRSALGMPQVQPYGGSEHIGQLMQEYGLVSPTRRPVAETIASLVSPTGLYATAAKAPQAARAGVRALDNLANARGMGRGLGNSQVGAIENLWHGSPHTFDRFDLSKIGTGEGAQAYGHGLYAAESPDVAVSYRDALGTKLSHSTGDIREGVRNAVIDAGGSEDDAFIAANEAPFAISSNDYSRLPESAAKYLADIKARQENTGNLYQLRLAWPDPAKEAATPLSPDDFLHWDKPLSEQSEAVRKALESSKNKNVRQMLDYLSQGYDNPLLADEVKSIDGGLRLMSLNLGGKATPDNPKISAILAKQGIPGIRYLDGGSRGAGAGSHNYVVFDDRLIDIVSRNGQPVGNLGKMVAPQDDALRVAQQNAAKPIEEGGLGLRPDNTPEERAAAMGFDIDNPMAHGTNKSIKKFKVGKGGYDEIGSGVYTAPIDDGPYGYALSNAWAQGDGGVNYPLVVNRDLADYDEVKSTFKIPIHRYPNGDAISPPNKVESELIQRIVAGDPSWAGNEELLRDQMRRIGADGAIRKAGYAGARSQNSQVPNQVVTFDPRNIRSRFAAFDPMRRDSSDILAGLAPLGLGAWMYQDEPVK